MLDRLVAAGALALASAGLGAQSLSVAPASPTPLDLIRLEYAHAGCTNLDSVQVSMSGNHVTVQADRSSRSDCGTQAGDPEAFTLGRLPAGDYDASLIINPPPPTLGPSQLLGPVQFTVARLPFTGSLHPHDDFSDVWWDPADPGWTLIVEQSGDALFAVWLVSDATGSPTWFVLEPGSWARDANGMLYFSGPVYRTTGPYWASGVSSATTFAVSAVGNATFAPQAVRRARFSFSVEGVVGEKTVERFRF